jgi:hypothetical protein
MSARTTAKALRRGSLAALDRLTYVPTSRLTFNIMLNGPAAPTRVSGISRSIRVLPPALSRSTSAAMMPRTRGCVC